MPELSDGPDRAVADLGCRRMFFGVENAGTGRFVINLSTCSRTRHTEMLRAKLSIELPTTLGLDVLCYPAELVDAICTFLCG
jgi:hypothetical protein